MSQTFVIFSSIVLTSDAGYFIPIAKHVSNFFVVVVEAFQYQTYILFTCDVYNSNNHLVFKLVNASRFKVVPAEIGKKYRKSLSCVPSHSINERIFFGAHCTLCQPYQKTCMSCWFLHWKVGGNSLLSFICKQLNGAVLLLFKLMCEKKGFVNTLQAFSLELTYVGDKNNCQQMMHNRVKHFLKFALKFLILYCFQHSLQ